MTVRQKKLLVLLIKVGVLICIVEYARRQAQWADALTVQAGGATLTSTASRAVELPQGTRLAVDVRTDDAEGKPLTYRGIAKDGTRFDIPAASVEDAPSGAAADTPRPFTMLPGMRTLLSGLRWRWLLLGFLLFGPPIFLMAVRWRILLVASGIEIPFLTLVRLHYLGFFFNTFMPGGAGGDIIKAVYVARHCSQKAEAATIVVIDRVVGLLGLLALAGGVVLVQYRAMRGIAVQVGTLSLVLFVAFALFFSPRFRRLVHYDAILSRIPRADVLLRIDAALYGLRTRKSAVAAAFVLTVALQLVEVVGISFAGRSLGMTKPTFAQYLAFVPIGYLVNAIPISFGGIGLMEGAFLTLFRDAGVATATEGFMLGVLARLLVVGWSVFGALSALFPPEREQTEAPTPAPSSL